MPEDESVPDLEQARWKTFLDWRRCPDCGSRLHNRTVDFGWSLIGSTAEGYLCRRCQAIWLIGLDDQITRSAVPPRLPSWWARLWDQRWKAACGPTSLELESRPSQKETEHGSEQSV